MVKGHLEANHNNVHYNYVATCWKCKKAVDPYEQLATEIYPDSAVLITPFDEA